MAYTLYLYKEFPSKSGKTIRLEIFERDYAGSAIELEALSPTPVTLTTDNTNNSVFMPIIKTYIGVNIKDTEQIDYTRLFTPDATKFKVIIKVNGTTEWAGYLTPDSFSQSLQYRSEINLIARDNLGMLSEFTYTSGNTFGTIRSLINAALSVIGFQGTLEYRVKKVDENAVNVLDGYVPLRAYTGKTYQEVLETLLTGIGCQLRYVGGNKYAIFDIADLKGYGDTITSQDFLFIDQSGMMELIPAWKDITISQDYLLAEEIISNRLAEDDYIFRSNQLFNVRVGAQDDPIQQVLLPTYDLLGAGWGGTLAIPSPYDFVGEKPSNVLLPIVAEPFITPPYIELSNTLPPYNGGLNVQFNVHNAFLVPDEALYTEGVLSLTDKLPTNAVNYGGAGILVYYSVILESGGKIYELSDAWEEIATRNDAAIRYFKIDKPVKEEGTDTDILTTSIDVPCSVNIMSLLEGGLLSFRFYGYNIYGTLYRRAFFDCIVRVSEFNFTLKNDEPSGRTTTTVIDANYNLRGDISLALGEVPASKMNYFSMLGGIYRNLSPYYPPMTGFQRTEAIEYHLSELVGREIAHHYKTQRKKLSGNIINSENFAAMPSFAKPFTDGTLTYALNYGSLDFRNEVMSVELIEVEDYETEDYTFIEATIDTGGTSLGSGETEFIQWSAAGNATRIYELDTASDTDKAGAYIVVDKLGLSAAKKVALSSKIDSTQNVLLKEPTGFKSPESVIITYNSTSRTITLTGTIEGYSNGVLISELVSGWVSTPHPATLDNIYYLYYNGSSIVWSGSFPGFQYLFIAVVYYRTNNPFAQRECHGLMQWQSHLSTHNNIGTYRLSGGDISNVVIGSTTADNRRPIISECIILDEDLATTNAALTSKKYSIRYLSGANTINYTLQANDIVPLLGNNPYYNSFTTPNYGQTLMPDNSAMTIWLFEVPTTADSASQEIRHAFVQGQSVTLAANASPTALATAVSTESLKSPIDLYLGENAVISLEYVCIHKFVITYSGGNWVVASSIKVTGSRQSQVGSPSGSYLTAVSTDDTIDGNGSPAFPLSVSAYAAKKAGDILQDFSAKKLTTATLLLPQSAPTLSSGEAAIYALDSGFSGETPSGAGTLTSVALTMPTGFSVSGSPITESGTFGVTFASGYRMFTETEIGNKIESSLIGAANGITPLDSGGKVALQYLPSTLLKYMGVWNASINSPTLTSPDTNRKGQVWNVSVAGSQFGLDFKLGDWLIYNDSGVAEKSDNSDDVTSVNGYTGAVTLKTSDIAEQTNLYYTDARVKAYADTLYLPLSGGALTGDLSLPNLYAFGWRYNDDLLYNYITNGYSATAGILYRSGSWLNNPLSVSHNMQVWQGGTWVSALRIYQSGDALFSAKVSGVKASFDTLLLPQTTPSLASGEMAIYGLESGFSGETPSGAGSVTSISIVVPTGLSVTPATITESGTFTISYASGYSIPTNTKQSEWDSAYTLRHNAVTLGTANGLSLSTQVLSLGLASTTTNGALSSTDWNTFNGKQAKLIGTSDSSLVRVNTLGVISYDDSTYLTGITKEQVEAVLTGTITSHNHTGTYALIGGDIAQSFSADYIMIDGVVGWRYTELDPLMYNWIENSYANDGGILYRSGSWTGTTTITSHNFQTWQGGTWVSALKIKQNGVIEGLATTDSTSYTNGALVLSGGLGIAKDLYSNGKAVFVSSVEMSENINTNLRIPKVAPTNPVSGEFYIFMVE